MICINLFHWDKVANATCSLITKKLYYIQNYFWNENVEKDSIILIQFNHNNYLKSRMPKL